MTVTDSSPQPSCPCVCHTGTDPQPEVHTRACCPAWNGTLYGPAGDSQPHIEARERARLARHLRHITEDDGGYLMGVRRFIDRHEGLHAGTSIVAVLLAAADEIEEAPDA